MSWIQDLIDKIRGKAKPKPVPVPTPTPTPEPKPEPKPEPDDGEDSPNDIPDGAATAPVFSVSGAQSSQPRGKIFYNYNPGSSRGTIKVVLQPGVRPHWVVAFDGKGWRETLKRAMPNEHNGMWRFYGSTRIALLPQAFYIRIGGAKVPDSYCAVADKTKRLG